MKKVIPAIVLGLSGFFVLSCSEDELGGAPQDPFEIHVIPVSDVHEIDKPVEFKISANQEMRSIGIARYSEGEELTRTEVLGGVDTASYLGTESTISTSFMFPGEETLRFEAENEDGERAEAEVRIQIGKGNAVKIKSVRVLSFYRKKEMWDDDDSHKASYPLRKFLSQLSKRSYSTAINDATPQSSFSKWHQLEEKNRGDELFWDLSNENVYINVSNPFHFDIGARNNEGIERVLRLIWPYSKHTEYRTLQEYEATKPDSIKLTGDQGNIEAILELEW